MPRSYLFFHLLALVLETLAVPEPQPTPDLLMTGTSFILPLRRSNNQQPFEMGDSSKVFDQDRATEEIRYVIVKYQDAGNVLKGIGLNKEPDLDKYFPVAETSILQDDPMDNGDSNNQTDPVKAAEPAPPIRPILAASGTAQMPLVDFISGGEDILYYGDIKIGTPAQELSVDIDTGSSDLWIPGTDCANCPSKKFNQKASTTFADQKKKYTVTYGSGDVHANLAKDVVSVSGLGVQNQSFGVVYSESDDFQGYPNSGLIGLAFSSIAASKQMTFFENLIQAKTVAQPLFSVYLTRGAEKGSEVCFGCMNTAKTIGTTRWVPVVSRTYWTVDMGGIAYNSAIAKGNNVKAAIDTGTTLIYVPSDLAKAFYDKIPDSRVATEYGSGLYAYPCNAAFTASLVFGGNLYMIHPSDFNLGRTSQGSSECIGGVLSMGNGFPSNLAIVGDEFLKSWYTTFDYTNGARVGFAPSINNKQK